jgi:hypothetical protein
MGPSLFEVRYANHYTMSLKKTKIKKNKNTEKITDSEDFFSHTVGFTC